jgi:hypothetical protein
MLTNDKVSQAAPLPPALAMQLQFLASLVQIRQRSSSSSKIGNNISSPQSTPGGQ